MFFALISSLLENRVRKICQREDRHTARARHTSRRRRILTPASPRHRARCNRHEARAGIVALISGCLVQLSNGGLGPPEELVLSSSACTQRSTRRGAALASRLDPLILSGDKRGRSKAPLFAELNVTSIPDPEPVRCSCDPESWAYRRNIFRDNRQRHHLRSHQLLASLQLYHYSIGFRHAWRTTFAILRTLVRSFLSLL